MKLRDSGMPDEGYWETLLDVPLIIERLGIERCHDVVELGCGYGTFTMPIAEVASGVVHTFDIDPEMVERTRERTAGLSVICEQRDVMQAGFGVQGDCILLFNILHCEQPVELLERAVESLNEGGKVTVIHWQHRDTPRGPSLWQALNSCTTCYEVFSLGGFRCMAGAEKWLEA